MFWLQDLVKDEGVYASAIPVFASTTKSLKTLSSHSLCVKVLRADGPTNTKGREVTEHAKDLVHPLRRELAKGPFHPKGAKPPKSFYPTGRTIWKWTRNSLTDPGRKWIEFDRRSGWPADEMDIWSDMCDHDSDGELLSM